MGAIPGLLGLGGGAAGTSFAAPTGTNIVSPIGAPEATNALNGTQNSMAAQQALLAALQAQNGFGLQNQAAQGYANLAAGVGPNPALAQLRQTTGENVANTGALMAGQRGASQNVGLIARQAAQQGANLQQQAVGQGATLAAQQQLQGLQGLAGQANTIAQQQIGQTNANTTAQQAQFANLMNAINAANNARVGMQGNINAGNVSLANTQMQGSQGALGNLMNSGASMMSMIPAGGAAHGGMIGMAEGGDPQGPQSEFGQFLAGVNAGGNTPAIGINSVTSSAAGTWAQGGNKGGGGGGKAKPAAGNSPGMGQPPAGTTGAPQQFAEFHGGMVDAMVSPGEIWLSPQKVNQVQSGADPKKVGEKIPGKARAPGDSYANDTVHKKLETGGVVVPRTKAKDSRTAANFVATTLAKKGKR